jgi:hypothetical protein
MIVEYIRYKIDPSRNDEFDEAYRRAGMLLDASPHCQRWEAARCVDEPEKQIVRIDSDSAEGHLQGFRQSADVKPFCGLGATFVAGQSGTSLVLEPHQAIDSSGRARERSQSQPAGAGLPDQRSSADGGADPARPAIELKGESCQGWFGT